MNQSPLIQGNSWLVEKMKVNVYILFILMEINEQMKKIQMFVYICLIFLRSSLFVHVFSVRRQI